MNTQNSQSTPSSLVVLITKAPTHAIAKHAIAYVRTAAKAQHDVQLFFYADGAMVANGLLWQPADTFSLTKEWQQLAKDYDLALKVCVSTALARGITDDDNAHRHKLPSSNLATGFSLVGLTELMLMMNEAKVVQF